MNKLIQDLTQQELKELELKQADKMYNEAMSLFNKWGVPMQTLEMKVDVILEYLYDLDTVVKSLENYIRIK